MADFPDLELKVVIRCADLEASRRFYTEVLALPVLEEWRDEASPGLELGFGDSGRGGRLELSGMVAEDPRYDTAFARSLDNDKIDLQLRTRDLQGWIEQLGGRWPFEGPEELPWGHRWIKLRDPDRLLVAIYEER